MNKKVKAIKEWAEANYESFGASALIECFSDEELDEKFESLADAKEYAGWKDEARSNTFPDDDY